MKLIVLDRDGVINEDSDHFVKSPSEWHPIPGSFQAIARLNRADYKVAVATNQSGVARGLFDVEMLSSMHNKMLKLAGEVGAHIDSIFFCPHAPDARCECRKPRPGLLMEIAQRYKLPLTNVPCVGDSLRDLEAAASVGGKPYLVRTGKGARTLESQAALPPGTEIFDDLAALARHLVPDDPHLSGGAPNH
ncbi:MAG: D-glycero-beta-D-manno-heptose 1,7-bisphosphate 7-phosphatase [Burkholderiaceae bacterium]